MQVDTEKQVVVIEKSIEVFKTSPAILKANQERTAKALLVGNSIIDQWAEAWKIEDAETRMQALAAADERSNKYLVNTSKAKGEMNQARAAITQLMTEFARMFTAAENELDKTKSGSVPAVIQDHRNQYVTEIAKEEKRKEKERAEKAAKIQARIDYKAKVLNTISTSLNTYLANKKVQITNSFNAITLETLEEKSKSLANMKCDFPKEKLGEIVRADEVTGPLIFSLNDFQEMLAEANMEFDHEAFYKSYEAEITELKRSLVDRLPSKKAELEEMKRLADEALENQKKQADAKGKILAALKLQQQIDEQKRLEKEAEVKAREEAEAAKLKEEAEKKQKADQLAIQLKSEGEKTLNLFDQVSEVATAENKAQTKTGVEIKIHHPAAYVQIFQFYFEKEGKNLSVVELGRKSLDQMKAFCEKAALKNDEKITGTTLLEYIETYKAVNKKPA